MQYAQLGRTGVFVSRICLGAMTFGGAENPVTSAIGRLSQDETDGIVGQALDASINFIDTADVYGGGASETRVGDALKGRRQDVVLATKFSARTGPGPNHVGQSRLYRGRRPTARAKIDEVKAIKQAGRSMREIAEALGISVGSVHGMLKAA